MSNENTLESLRNTIISSMGQGRKRAGDNGDESGNKRVKTQELTDSNSLANGVAENSSSNHIRGPNVRNFDTNNLDNRRGTFQNKTNSGYRNYRRENRSSYGNFSGNAPAGNIENKPDYNNRNYNRDHSNGTHNNRYDRSSYDGELQKNFNQRDGQHNYSRGHRDTRGHYNRQQLPNTYNNNDNYNNNRHYNNYNNYTKNYRVQQNGPSPQYNENQSSSNETQVSQADRASKSSSKQPQPQRPHQQYNSSHSYQQNSYGQTQQHYNNYNNESNNYIPHQRYNNNKHNNLHSKNYQNQNRHNMHNNTHNKNYVPPAFRDVNRYEKITGSTINNKLVVEGELNSDLVNSLGNIITNLIQNQDFITTEEKNLTQIDYDLVEDKSKLIITFNYFKFTTLIISCSKFINKQLGVDIVIKRPNSYIEQVDNMNEINSDHVFAIEDDIGKDEITTKLNTNNFELVPIKYADSIETKCQLVILNKSVKTSLNNMNIPTIKPNEGNLKQFTTRLLFSDMLSLADPQLAPQNDKISRPKLPVPPKTVPKSNVLLILNAMDPTDLKDESFVNEVKDTLTETLSHVEDIKIITPKIDYRLNIDHIGDHVGNIYAKFKDVKSCEENLALINGAQFNDRTLICAYVDTADFDVGVFN